LTPDSRKPSDKINMTMNSTIQEYYDVAIVGAGPCGVTVANLLGKYGVKTLLIDREDDIVAIPRAVGICEEGSRVLQAAGVMMSVKPETRAIEKVVFADKNQQHVFHGDLDVTKNGYPLLSTFHQPDIERVIRKGLERFDHVELHMGTQLLSFEDAADEVTLKLHQGENNLTTKCRFLLACDGAKSSIRKTLNIGFGGNTYPQDWLILDVENNPIPGNNVIFTINPDRPSVTIPGPNKKRRWEFVIKKDDCTETIFEEENLHKLLEPWGDSTTMDIARKAIYTFHARVAERYRRGNVFLMGDAAHITPPFAGQGMMAGLRDTYNIAWKLAAVINGQLSEQVLDSYDKERIPQSQQVIGFAQRMGDIILPQKSSTAIIRDLLIKLLGFLGLHSETRGIPLNKIPNHINGSLVRNFFVSRFSKTGIEFPQHELEGINGEVALSDHWMGDSFHLLGWNQDAEKWLDTRTLDRWQSLSPHRSIITGELSPSADKRTLLDRHGHYRELFGQGNRVVVMRPDKMMVINCKPLELNTRLNRYLDDIGCIAA